jgi:hypothetical protein
MAGGSSVDDVGVRVQYVQSPPKMGRALTVGPPSFLGKQATMMAASNSLPTRNEEYGTREYWCALTHHLCFLLSFFLFRDQRYAQ